MSIAEGGRAQQERAQDERVFGEELQIALTSFGEEIQDALRRPFKSGVNLYNVEATRHKREVALINGELRLVAALTYGFGVVGNDRVPVYGAIREYSYDAGENILGETVWRTMFAQRFKITQMPTAGHIGSSFTQFKPVDVEEAWIDGIPMTPPTEQSLTRQDLRTLGRVVAYVNAFSDGVQPSELPMI